MDLSHKFFPVERWNGLIGGGNSKFPPINNDDGNSPWEDDGGKSKRLPRIDQEEAILARMTPEARAARLAAEARTPERPASGWQRRDAESKAVIKDLYGGYCNG